MATSSTSAEEQVPFASLSVGDHNPAPGTSKLKTIRISLIPKSITFEELQTWLEALVGPEHTPAVVQLSIAPNSPKFCQATATLAALPAKFKDIEAGTLRVQGPKGLKGPKVEVDVHFDGMTVLYDPLQDSTEPASVDIVAVTGLGGHALGSWKSKQGHDIWLRDFLPDQIESIRTITYGYNTKLADHGWKTTISELARTFLDRLESVHPKDNPNRPIIFLGHSLGGLIIKQALIIVADEHKNYAPYQNVFQRCCGVMFFGVPNEGIRYEELVTIVKGRRNEYFIHGLQSDEDTDAPEILKELARNFGRVEPAFGSGANKGLNIFCYYEKRKTQTLQVGHSHPTMRLLVPQISAIHTGGQSANHNILPLEGDHSSMVKFKNMSDEEYLGVVRKIEGFIQSATQHEEELDISKTISSLSQDDISFIQSLAYLEMTYRRDEADEAHPDTCTWILDHEEYKNWIHMERGLLWIKGVPGAGKSTLMSFLCRHLEETSAAKGDVNLHFFFHGRGVLLQHSMIGMFRSLLYQLYMAIPSTRQPGRRKFHEKKLAGKSETELDWQLKELQALFSESVIRIARSQSLTILVDALDEAGTDAAKILVSYFDKLNCQLTNSSRHIKLCISCRHYPILDTTSGFKIHVEQCNKSDISKFIRYELQLRANVIVGSMDMRNLEDAISNRASGVFQWPSLILPLVIEQINDGESKEEVLQLLSKVPKGLGDVYEYILNEIVKSKPSLTLHMMQWICFAERPLSVTELRFAIAADERPQNFCKDVTGFVSSDDRMERLIISRSGGLAEIKQHSEFDRIRGYEIERRIVQFIHQSVKDFLVTKGLALLFAKTSIDFSTVGVVGMSHGRLCRSCINYLRSCEVTQVEAKSRYCLRLLPFIEYAAYHWILHAKKAEILGYSHEYLAEDFDTMELSFQAWVRNYSLLICGKILPLSDANKACQIEPIGMSQIIYSGTFEGRRFNPDTIKSMLCLAISSGLLSTLKALLKKKVYAELYLECGTLINLASIYKHDHLVDFFLHYYKLNSVQDSVLQAETLVKCSVAGYVGAVRILLENGVNPNNIENNKVQYENQHPYNEAPEIYKSALEGAIIKGHSKIVELLLDNGADINSQSNNPLLIVASAHGNEMIIKKLLERGANINAQGGFYGNALQAASYGNSKAVVKILLEEGADINAKGGYYGTALQAASYNGDPALVEILLEVGADINAQGGYYGNPLQAASVHFQGSSDEKLVKVLLEAGANVNTHGGRYGNALRAAICNQNPCIVRLLLEYGAKADDLWIRSPEFPIDDEELGFDENMALLLRKHGATAQTLKRYEDEGRTIWSSDDEWSSDDDICV